MNMMMMMMMTKRLFTHVASGSDQMKTNKNHYTIQQCLQVFSKLKKKNKYVTEEFDTIMFSDNMIVSFCRNSKIKNSWACGKNN